MNLLTIFTPTFNRAYILPILYESLLLQSNKGFEWLIVDDGSNDNTNEIIERWIDNGKLNIRYYRQENQGKPMAHNKGVELCDTPLFYCVDSDDSLPKDAVQYIYDLYNEEMDNNLLGFYMRRGDKNGNPVGANWPNNIRYTTLNGLYMKYRYSGETAIILYTEKIRPYKFPKFEGEIFIRESVFYDELSDIAPMRLDDRIGYLFEYREDGYTAQGMRLEFNNPVGTGYNYLHRIRYVSGLLEKCKYMGKYLAWKELLCIDEPIYKTIRTSIFVKIAGYLLKKHYFKLLSICKETLDNEV